MGMGAARQVPGGKGMGAPIRQPIVGQPVRQPITQPGPVQPQPGMGMGKGVGAPAPGGKGMMPTQRPMPGMGKGIGAPAPGGKGMMPNRPGVDVYKTQMDYLNAVRGNPAPGGKGMMPNPPGGTPLPNRGTLVGFGPTDAPIYSTDPNAKGYTGPYMGGQYFNNGLLVPPPQRMPQQPLPSLGAGIAALDPRMFA